MLIFKQSPTPEQPSVTHESNSTAPQPGPKVESRESRPCEKIYFTFRHFRDHLSLSLMNPRTRRFSCSSNSNGTNSGLVSPGPRLAPRISQLRQEECVDVHNREATHEREVHSALSISQSYEDLTLVMSENWTFRNSDEFSNPLHVSLSTNSNACSSPSPTK